jgi:tetratricopeptide (TPR) repeat protein
MAVLRQPHRLAIVFAAAALASAAQRCATCHAAAHREWAQSPHAKMLQAATEQTVEGDFTRGDVTLHGATFSLQRRAGAFFISNSRVDYVLGSGRIQEYLSKLPDGRIVLLAAVWDNIRKTWVHDVDVQNPEEAPGPAPQVWNKTCYSCHVSGGKKNFDLQTLRYDTTWRSAGIDCERCHGTAIAHAAKPAAARNAVVNPARLDPARSVAVCAQCHSFRDVYVDGFQPGANYSDYFLPVMQYRVPPSEDPPYWPDGRPRWVSNDAAGLWQSQCYLKGRATCVTCHSQAHSMRASADANAGCAGCHAAIVAKLTAHTHHAANSRGSSCVECHMPTVVAGVAAPIRDHSMSIPVPENTIRHDTPNACNLCHNDRDAQWALQQMNLWYGDKSRQTLMHRADAFARAQKRDASATAALLDILFDPSGGPVVRANAAGFLGNFPNDPAAYEAVLRSFSDPEPLVRAVAALSIRPRAAQREAVAPELIALLKDDVTTVRINAAVALVAMGVRQLSGDDGERFERAKALYRSRAELDSDNAAQQYAAGRFSFMAGDPDGAVSAFRAALKLDPGISARYYLAAALAQKGDLAEARQILAAIPRNDLQYQAAQRLLARIKAEESTEGQSSTAQKLFLEGELEYRNGNYGAALKQLDQALKLSPRAEWTEKAKIFRAVCFEKLSRTSEAEAAMQALSTDPSASADLDLQLSYVELLYDTGRPEQSLQRIEALLAAAPDAPMGHLWRAKALLQLHRTDEAALAAEKAVRLQPELAAAHNLLIRIYQMQGRMKEAAEQAQWLRDYQRRMQSR